MSLTLWSECEASRDDPAHEPSRLPTIPQPAVFIGPLYAAVRNFSKSAHTA
jgi:hypothetical protein